ncbi:hypothetical protein P261_02750 [Lachnospiraceae bacterium TWA4]|nr:hypothetical protein P261_02750 [Lachnospiraceae bacterium TWA4]
MTTAKGACSKLGFDSSLAYNWTKQTNEKVWIINAAEGNTSITSWIPTGNNFKQAVALYQQAAEVLQKECHLGHYYLKHKGYFFLQGENDKKMSSLAYKNYFLQMHKGLENQLTLEFAGLLTVRAGMNKTCTKDFKMNGPRTAQKQLAKENNNIYMVSTISDLWTDDKSVANYFKKAYKSINDYHIKNPMSDKNVKIPSTVNDVHSTIHYDQLGYNEIGREAAKNMTSILHYKNTAKRQKLSLYLDFLLTSLHD